MTRIDPLAEKARRKMVARRMTPEVLAAQDGILAVFVGTEVCLGEVWQWWPSASHVKELSLASGSTDIVVHIDLVHPVVIRFMVVDGLHCAVVYRPDGRIMKSLPRSMRRCIEHVRKSMKESST